MSVYQEAYHLPEFTYDYEKLKIEQRDRSTSAPSMMRTT